MEDGEWTVAKVKILIKLNLPSQCSSILWTMDYGLWTMDY